MEQLAAPGPVSRRARRFAAFFLLISAAAGPWTAGGEAASAGRPGRSYAVVVGIDEYASPQWETLRYALLDGRAVAELLRRRGFDVRALYDREATRRQVLGLLEATARELQDGDRVLVFFAGHGHTESIGGRDWGYIVPHDGRDTSSYISMRELQNVSEQMGRARHQLFIMDACYGGLFGLTRGAQVAPAPAEPHRIQELRRRRAREYLTAGGKDQVVQDLGPDGHSTFTGQLLKAIGEGFADHDLDGYVTFSELASYLEGAASDRFQTPSRGVLPGHEGGSFLFEVGPAGARSGGGTTSTERPGPPARAAAPLIPLGPQTLRLRAGSPVSVEEIGITAAIELGNLDGTPLATVLISAPGGVLARQAVLGAGTSFSFDSAGRRFHCNVVAIDWQERSAVVTLEESATAWLKRGARSRSSPPSSW